MEVLINQRVKAETSVVFRVIQPVEDNNYPLPTLVSMSVAIPRVEGLEMIT